MRCPSLDFLKNFVQSPDEAMNALPGFEEHLDECPRCQAQLDLLAEASNDQLLDKVLGKRQAFYSGLPEIDGYQILEQVGRGGFGAAFRAIQISTGFTVAIKLLFQLTSDDSERFDNERQIVAQQSHPNIVALLDAGHFRGGYFLVYRWMESNLSNWMKSRDSLPVAEVLRIMKEVATAVEYLHSNGILHRDLKPSNVLIDDNGGIKLTDFGIAKKLTPEDATSNTALPLGTPNYMAPEQTGMSDGRVGVHTDIYGLGALFYALLLGRPPFVGEHLLQICQQVAGEEPIAPGKLRPSVSRDCENVILKCLEKEQCYRYQNVLGLLQDLRRLESGVPVQAKPPSLIRKARRWGRKYPRAVAWSLAACSFVLLSIIAFLWDNQRWREASEQLVIIGLFEQLKSADSAGLELSLEAIEKVKLSKRLELSKGISVNNPVHRLRLWIASQSNQELGRDELIEGIQQSEVMDLTSIQPRIRAAISQPNRQSDILAAWRAASDPLDVLKLATLIDASQVDSETREHVSSRVIQVLETRPRFESKVWEECLENFANDVTDVLIRELVECPLEQRSKFSMATALAMKWNAKSSNHASLLKIIELATVDCFKVLAQEPDLLTDGLLQLSRERTQALKATGVRTIFPNDAPDHESGSEHNRLSDIRDLLESFAGVATNESGFLMRVPADNFRATLQRLNEAGFAASSLQRYQDESGAAFTLTFAASNAKNDFLDLISQDNWRETLSKKEEIGFGVASIWPNEEYSSIDVLLLELQPSSDLPSFHVESTEIQDLVWATPSSPILRTTPLVRPWKHTYTGFLQEDKTSFGFKQEWPVDYATRRYPADVPQLPLTPLGQRTITSYLELGSFTLSRSISYPGRNISLWTTHPCDQGEFLEKAAHQFKLGLQPKQICRHPGTGQYAGFWEFDQGSAESLHRCLAMNVLLLWLGGETSPLLEELKYSAWPSCRTWIIHSLSSIDSTAQSWAELYRDSLDADQLNAWIIAGSEFRWENMDRMLSNHVQNRMTQLVDHPDSGVSSSARWFLQNAMQVKASTPDSMAEPSQTHRSWYYSSSGIPFIVIDTDAIHLLGEGTKLPWNREVFSDTTRLNRTIAMSAIEIPKELFELFLEENPNPSLSQHQFNVPWDQSPAMGINYHSALKFCRWLSLREGIDSDAIGIPDLDWEAPDTPQNGDEWGRGILDKDGYRLPTGIEWEIACRCGTISSSFHGETDEYLSKYAWNSHNAPLAPMPIASLAPNPWGFFDILGNVYETNLGGSIALYAEYTNQKHLNFEVEFKQSVNLRGGSFLSNRAYCVSGAINAIPSSSKDRNTGFRIVRTLKSELAN
ncbi:protein kinase domain-containing protein [Pirellulaceae bacterium SH449]